VAGNLLHYDQFFYKFNVSALSKTLLHMLHQYSLREEEECLGFEASTTKNDVFRKNMMTAVLLIATDRDIICCFCTKHYYEIMTTLRLNT
jgi:hypothetical protein